MQLILTNTASWMYTSSNLAVRPIFSIMNAPFCTFTISNKPKAAQIEEYRIVVLSS